MHFNGRAILHSFYAFFKSDSQEAAPEQQHTAEEQKSSVSIENNNEISLDYTEASNAWYKNYFKIVKEDCEENYNYLTRSIEEKVQMLPCSFITAENFKLSDATHFAIKEVKNTEENALCDASEHVKVLLEIMIVLEHIFRRYNEEYDENTMKLSTTNKKLAKLSQEEIETLELSKNELKRQENIKNSINEEQKRVVSQNSHISNMLFSINELMKKIVTFVSDEFYKSKKDSAREFLFFPQNIRIDYEGAMGFLLAQDKYQCFIEENLQHDNREDSQSEHIKSTTSAFARVDADKHMEMEREVESPIVTAPPVDDDSQEKQTPSDPPVFTDLKKGKIPKKPEPTKIKPTDETEDPIQDINNHEEEAIKANNYAKFQELAKQISEILEDGISELAEINKMEENEALKQSMEKLKQKINERLKTSPNDETLKKHLEGLQKNSATFKDYLEKIKSMDIFAKGAKRSLEKYQTEFDNGTIYNVVLNNMNGLKDSIEARLCSAAIADIRSNLCKCKEHYTKLASELEKKIPEDKNKPSFMGRVYNHKGKIVIGITAIIIVIAVVIMVRSKGFALPEAAI
ncbi:hypothetical protein ENBRE01_1673 [Enteropsectra breve]|nr:hypothetical protein ENBRE01_1673 [Enteropsectra breve]